MMKPIFTPHAASAVLTCPVRRWQSSLARLEPEMQARKIRPVFEDLTPLSSYRLDVSLADFLPVVKSPRMLPPADKADVLPIPHHLLYFEPSLPPHDLLPDGTNPAHSPGAPFHRRMWAGGSVHYSSSNPLRLDGRRAVCVEGIRSAVAKGRPGEEKIFVGIERRIGYAHDDEVRALAAVDPSDDAAVSAIEDSVRKRMWRDRDDDPGDAAVLERRNIVFLRDQEQKSSTPADASSSSPPKILKPNKEPSLFSHTFVPNAQLLFRFSALTFNAHAIHLDPHYCRTHEGHRDLLFHGPLSYTLMLTLLRQNLPASEHIGYVEYRNLAPVYCNEPVTVCGAGQAGAGKYDVWIEGPDGGVKVKGTVRTTTL